MSATSEELAAQSEQLQASISYFRIEHGAYPSVTARQPARPAAPAGKRPTAPRRHRDRAALDRR